MDNSKKICNNYHQISENIKIINKEKIEENQKKELLKLKSKSAIRSSEYRKKNSSELKVNELLRSRKNRANATIETKIKEANRIHEYRKNKKSELQTKEVIRSRENRTNATIEIKAKEANKLREYRKNKKSELQTKEVIRSRENRNNMSSDLKAKEADRLREYRKRMKSELKTNEVLRSRKNRNNMTSISKTNEAIRLRKYRKNISSEMKENEKIRSRQNRANMTLELKEKEALRMCNYRKSTKRNENIETVKKEAAIEIANERKRKILDNTSDNINIQNENFDTTDILSITNSQSPFVGLIANKEFDETLILTNYIGNLDHECKFCNAKHFKGEMSQDKKYSHCCHKNKVHIDHNTTYPDELKNLLFEKNLISINYRKNIRNYNNLFAFASFGSKSIHFNTVGQQVFKICGQVYHNSYALHPNDNDNPKYGQLYIIDNEIANKHRQNQYNNDKMDIELIEYLEKYISANNPYAEAYKMMYKVEEEENIKAINNHTTPREIIMLLTRDNDTKNKSYFATCNEVAVVYVGNDGEPPVDRDICIYSKKDKPERITILSKHLDPMVYP